MASAACDLLGYTGDEILRLPPDEVILGFNKWEARHLFEPVAEGMDQRRGIEARYRTKAGNEIPIEVSLQRVRINGDRIVAIGRDIRERKRTLEERDRLLRQALEAVRVRDEFLSQASHELKTPLTTLKLFVDSLMLPWRNGAVAEAPPGKDALRAGAAARQIHRLENLIDNLLEVAEIRSGRLEIHPEPVDLSSMAARVVSRYAVEAQRAASPITVHAEGPVTGPWDRLRLEQVLVNLLTNAIKFGAGKPIDVTVEAKGPQAFVMVRDHGVGIPLEAQQRIFHTFEQAISGVEFGGLGIGLYFVEQIVRAHGGTVGVKSYPGEGATFTVELPRQPVSPDSRPHQQGHLGSLVEASP